MLSKGNLFSMFLVYTVFYCLLLVSRIQCAYRVDAHERAKRYVFNSEVPLERRQLDENHIAIRDLLGLKENEHMEISEHIKTVQGSKVWRLHEKYLGIPVFDVSLTVSTDETGHLTGDATGEFVQGIEQDISSVTPHLSKSEVLDIVLQLMGDKKFEDEILSTKCQLVVYIDDSHKAFLVYKVEYLLVNEAKVERPSFLIDANTGEVLLNWNNLDTVARLVEGVGGNEKMGFIYYDKKHRKSYLTQIGDTCFLENDYVKVIDMQYNRKINDTDPVNFSCEDDYYDEVNGAFSPALDAYYNANIVHRMFYEWYGMSPLGKQILFRVHFGVSYENAFWDGNSCTFGDGGYIFYPLTSLDVSAHELGHGVTERFSGLLYFDESGSINEAFSDMTGEAAEAFDFENDWKIGADIMKQNEAMRYFEDPRNDNYSIIHYENFTYDTDPHFGSGIYNHVFYIIVQEGQLPIKEVYRVFLVANQMYWHQRTTFTSGACDVMKAAYDLGKDISIFRNAFERVGIKVCNVSKHILGLVSNRTLMDIRVEPQVHPLFSFAYPPWAANITIHANSDCGEVHVKVSYGNEIYKNSTVIAEGTTHVIIETVASDKIFIQLSPEKSKKLTNVHLIATYSCSSDFLPDSLMEYFLYYEYCQKETDNP